MFLNLNVFYFGKMDCVSEDHLRVVKPAAINISIMLRFVEEAIDHSKKRPLESPYKLTPIFNFLAINSVENFQMRIKILAESSVV